MLTSCASPPTTSDESYSTSEMEMDVVATDAGEMEMDAVAADAAEMEMSSEAPEDFNTEEYSSITENGFRSVSSAPLSTFSVDVDTASYSNVRRMILGKEPIPPDAVRIEEFINYFKYEYPEPKNNEPFSITTEMADCPWNNQTKLLLVGLQAKNLKKDKLPKSNIVFLIDVSGSMDFPEKLPLLKKAFSLLSESLKEDDKVSIVTYAGNDQIVLDGVSGNNQYEIITALENLFAYGSTGGAKGIESAYKLAEKHFIEDGNNRVILATDGDFNVGITSESELKSLIEQKRKKGIYLSVLGFGMGSYKDNKMETLADNGNGNYAYIDSELEAKKVLVEEFGGTMFTVAKDVKLQVEFNPKFIKGYRLIGYENRLLNDEDFENDEKDAGEIGAGHNVTALYELVPIDSKQEIPSAPDLKYQSNSKITDSTEWLTINIRYKEPTENDSKLLTKTVDEHNLDELSSNIDFAAGVAQFGMLLRDSQFAGTSSYDGIIDRLSKRTDIQHDEYKQEFLYLVKQAKEQGL